MHWFEMILLCRLLEPRLQLCLTGTRYVGGILFTAKNGQFTPNREYLQNFEYNIDRKTL